MNTPLKQKEAAMAILSNASKSTDLKLYQLFELYKDDLRKENNPLYYALLDWADKHAHDLVDNDTLRTELYKNLLEERSTARKCTFRQMGECGRHSECLRCRYAKDVNDLFNQFLEIPVDANGCIAHSFFRLSTRDS